MYEILEELMREFNVRPYHISKVTGISSSVFTDWKKGRYTPKIDKLDKIAGFFGLPGKVFSIDVSDLPNYIKENADPNKAIKSACILDQAMFAGLDENGAPVYEASCPELTEKEQALVDMFRQLDPDDQAEVRGFIHGLLVSGKYKRGLLESKAM